MRTAHGKGALEFRMHAGHGYCDEKGIPFDEVGKLGEVHPWVLESHGLEQPVSVLGPSLARLLA